MRTFTRFRVGILVPLCLMFSPSAWAENPLLDDAPAVIKSKELLSGRHIIAPQFGISLGDEYTRNLMAGLSWRYYFTSWIGLGADILAGGSIQTQLADDIDKALSQSSRSAPLSTTSLQLLANATVEIVPLSGKALLFGEWLVRADLHVTAGAGVGMVNGTGRIPDSISVVPMFGIGTRIFPNDWLSVNLDIKDYFVNRALASRKDGSVPGAKYGNNWIFTVGIGFSLPTAMQAP